MAMVRSPAKNKAARKATAKKSTKRAAKKRTTKTSKRTRGPDKRPRKKRSDNPVPPPKGPAPRTGTGGDGLPKGAVSALRSLRHRVPDSAPREAREIADEALIVIYKVMMGDIKGLDCRTRMTAARIVREEICGPVPRVVQLTGQTQLAKRIIEAQAQFDPEILLGEKAS